MTNFKYLIQDTAAQIPVAVLFPIPASQRLLKQRPDTHRITRRIHLDPLRNIIDRIKMNGDQFGILCGSVVIQPMGNKGEGIVSQLKGLVFRSQRITGTQAKANGVKSLAVLNLLTFFWSSTTTSRICKS